MSKFYKRLSYSIGNEDPNTEHKALQINRGDKVLCITASGDRPLHLLLNGRCGEIVSIDLNVIQNHLLKLKIAALRQLDYDQYINFLGVVPNQHYPQRKEYLMKLSLSMDQEASNYWLENQKMVLKGVLYQGAVEKFVRVIAKTFLLLRGKSIHRLFQFDNLELQREFVSQHWDRPWLKNMFNIVLQPRIIKMLKLFLDDPGLFNFGPSINPGTYLYNRLISCLNHSLAKENLMFSWIFRGYIGQEAYPPYLTREGFHLIREHVSRISIQTQNVIDYLEKAEANSFNCFSLSDIVSYMNAADFKKLLREVYRTACPGARFCMRQFLSTYEIPEELGSYFQRDRKLEAQLEKEDACLVYRFIVGKIDK